MCAVLGVLGSTPLLSCMFPDYQTGMVAAGGMAASGASASAGSVNQAGSAGSAGASGAGTSMSGFGGATQAGTSAQGGVSALAGEAGTSGTEPLGGAAGAMGETGIVIFDDFEDQSDDGWFATTPDWEVGSDGTSQVYRIVNLLDQSLFTVIGELGWTDMTVEAKVTVLEWGGTNTSDLVGVYARFESQATHYYVALRGDGKLALRKKIATNVTLGTPVDLALTTDKPYRVKLEIVGDELKAYVDDVLHITVTDSDIPAGRVGLGADNARAAFDDVRITVPAP